MMETIGVKSDEDIYLNSDKIFSVAIYLRVSSREQKVDGHSIANQEQSWALPFNP